MIRNPIINRCIVPITLFFISFLITFPYIEKGIILGVGEMAHFINPFILKPFYLWNDSKNFGTFNPSTTHISMFVFLWKILDYFSFLAHPTVLYLFLSAFLPGFFFYLMVNAILNIENKLVYLPACLLYSFNIFRLQTAYLSDVVSNFFVLLPLFFLFYYKLMNEEKWKFVCILTVLSIFASSLGANIGVYILIFIFLFLYFLYFLFTKKFNNVKKVLILNGVFLTLVIIGGLFWTIPILTILISFVVDTNTPITSWNAVSAGNIFDHFRFLGGWAFRSGHVGIPYFSYASNYYKPILILSTFTVAIISFKYLFFIKNKFRYKSVMIFFMISTIISFTVVCGGKGIFGNIYNFFYANLPFFKMYREPWAKFTPLFIFCISFGLTFSIDIIFRYFKNKIIPNAIVFILSLLILFNVYPLFTRESMVFQRWNQGQTGIVLKIPPYWEQLNIKIEKRMIDENIALFPFTIGAASHNFEFGGHVTGNIANYLSRKRFLNCQIYNNSIQGIIIRNILNNEDGYLNLKKYLGFFNTKYILQENDVEWRYHPLTLPPSESNKRIIDQGFVEAEEFGEFTNEYLERIPNEETDFNRYIEFYNELKDKPALVLYKMGNEYFMPHFYTPKSVLYIE